MPKWKQEDFSSPGFNQQGALKFTDKYNNSIYMIRGVTPGLYKIEFESNDSNLKQRCRNLSGYTCIPGISQDPDTIRMISKDKEVLATFIELLDESDPLENVKDSVYAFLDLPRPLVNEKNDESSVNSRVNELTKELERQKGDNASMMAIIVALQQEVVKLKRQLAAIAPKKDDAGRRTPGMW